MPEYYPAKVSSLLPPRHDSASKVRARKIRLVVSVKSLDLHPNCGSEVERPPLRSTTARELMGFVVLQKEIHTSGTETWAISCAYVVVWHGKGCVLVERLVERLVKDERVSRRASFLWSLVNCYSTDSTDSTVLLACQECLRLGSPSPMIAVHGPDIGLE